MHANETSQSRLVYLAGPIDLIEREESQSWRAEAAALLRECGFGVFSPAHAFELALDTNTDTAMSVLAVNNAALGFCDAILANLAGPGYGTPVELHIALAARKVGTCFNGKDQSLYVKTWPHYPSMKTAITALVQKHDARNGSNGA